MGFYKFLIGIYILISSTPTLTKHTGPRIGIICDCPDALELTAQLIAYGNNVIAIDCNQWIIDIIYKNSYAYTYSRTHNILHEGVYENNLAIIPDLEQGIQLCDIILYIADPEQDVTLIEPLPADSTKSKTMVCIANSNNKNSEFISSNSACSYSTAQVVMPLYEHQPIQISSSSPEIMSLLAKLFFPYTCIECKIIA